MTSVWYAAYGSNLDRARFLCYVQGGRPAGATRTYPGCTDPSPPGGDRPLVLPYRLYFAGPSTVWGGGGVAFVRTEPDPGAGTLGRAWLLGAEQFADVVRQENGHDPAGTALDLTLVLRDGAATLGDGWYEHLLLCGDESGTPVITVTSRSVRAELPPSAAYLDHLVAGLRQAHGLTEPEARAYLERRIS